MRSPLTLPFYPRERPACPRSTSLLALRDQYHPGLTCEVEAAPTDWTLGQPLNVPLQPQPVLARCRHSLAGEAEVLHVPRHDRDAHVPPPANGREVDALHLVKATTSFVRTRQALVRSTFCLARTTFSLAGSDFALVPPHDASPRTRFPLERPAFSLAHTDDALAGTCSDLACAGFSPVGTSADLACTCVALALTHLPSGRSETCLVSNRFPQGT